MPAPIGRSFSATILSRLVSPFALYTSPIPPAPRKPVIGTGPSRIPLEMWLPADWPPCESLVSAIVITVQIGRRDEARLWRMRARPRPPSAARQAGSRREAVRAGEEDESQPGTDETGCSRRLVYSHHPHQVRQMHSAERESSTPNACHAVEPQPARREGADRERTKCGFFPAMRSNSHPNSPARPRGPDPGRPRR